MVLQLDAAGSMEAQSLLLSGAGDSVSARPALLP